jgi:hypothetical protein
MNLNQLYSHVARRIADEEALRAWRPLDPALWRPWRVPLPHPLRREGWAWRDRLAWRMDRVRAVVRGEVAYWRRVARWWVARRMEE